MSHEIFTGKITEAEMFGEVLNKKEFGDIEYLTYGQAKEDVEKNQPGDPKEPSWRPFCYDLHSTLAEEISPDDYSRLEFYTAVRSALDEYHGVDAFFRFNDSNDGIREITLDGTENRKKEDGKADVLIRVPEMENPEFKMSNPEYMEWINQIVSEIKYIAGIK